MSTVRGLHIMWGNHNQDIRTHEIVLKKGILRSMLFYDIIMISGIILSSLPQSGHWLHSPLSISSPSSECTAALLRPIWSWTDNYDTIWRSRSKMLLLVLQPLILFCVNNKLLAIKLNRRCAIFLQSSKVYLSRTKNHKRICFVGR